MSTFQTTLIWMYRSSCKVMCFLPLLFCRASISKDPFYDMLATRKRRIANKKWWPSNTPESSYMCVCVCVCVCVFYEGLMCVLSRLEDSSRCLSLGLKWIIGVHLCVKDSEHWLGGLQTGLKQMDKRNRTTAMTGIMGNLCIVCPLVDAWGGVHTWLFLIWRWLQDTRKTSYYLHLTCSSATESLKLIKSAGLIVSDCICTCKHRFILKSSYFIYSRAATNYVLINLINCLVYKRPENSGKCPWWQLPKSKVMAWFVPKPKDIPFIMM